MENESDSENDENQLPEGTFAVALSRETQEQFEVVPNWHVSTLEPQKEIPLELLQAHIAEHKEDSDFHIVANEIKSCKLLAPLLIFDPDEQFGEEFLICLSGEAKYGYLQNEEDANMAMVDTETKYQYIPPTPVQWTSLKSDEVIERDWVTDSRPKIRLQVKRNVARADGGKVTFSDRNVDDVIDGYVACESYTDTHQWEHVDEMERAMQAVPILVEGSSQTELKHPKNLYTQYEPRVFTEDEVTRIWESPEMKRFMTKAEDIMKEVVLEPDIMGNLREDIESFYRRDHVEVVEETELVEHTFFTDLNFSHDCRVSQIRWHPTIEGIVAMSVVENSMYEEYLNNLTKRLVMPTMIMIWSMSHPLFPQILLRVPDDVTVIEWHPLEDDILIGGCMNGQVVIWDIGEYSRKFKRKECVWDHSIVMTKQVDKLHIEDGFIPIVYWSAESNIETSHKSTVENMKWLPKNVWFSQESAYPKVNQDEENRQFITCAADMYILVWDLLAPQSDDVEGGGAGENVEDDAVAVTRKMGKSSWAKLKSKSTLTPLASGAKWSPSIGKYCFLNKVWRPVHQIQFLDPTPPPSLPGGHRGGMDDIQFLKVLITSLSVTARQDLMVLERKGSSAGTKSGGDGKSQSATRSASESDGSGRESRSSLDGTKGGVDGDDDLPPPDPLNMALPTMLMAGTIIGTIFKADLSKNRVDVETNNLLCTIEWLNPVHDGPVSTMLKSPFMDHLLLTMGGYSFAIWNEGIMNKPVIMHYVDSEQFTSVAWSIEQPNIIFFSGEKGSLEVWDITKRKSEPIQSQNISGRAINAICPYKTKVTKGNDGHYISIGDNSGTLRLMTLPKHLWEPTDLSLEDLQAFIDAEIAKKQEKERLKNDREKTRRMRFKKTIDEELEEDTKVVEPDDEYLIFYFQRERQVLSNLYGSDWRSYLKHPEWPREDYEVQGSRRSSSTTTSALSTTRKQSIVSSMTGRARTIAPFLKPGANLGNPFS